MSIRYKDIVRDMERHGHYSEAQDFERALERSGRSDYDDARYDPRDGAGHSYVGDVAERSYENLRHEEWRQREAEENRQREAEEVEAHRRFHEQQEQEQEQYPEQYPEEKSQAI